LSSVAEPQDKPVTVSSASPAVEISTSDIVHETLTPPHSTSADSEAPEGLDAGIDTEAQGGIDLRIDTEAPEGIDSDIDTKARKGIDAGIDTKAPEELDAGIDTKAPEGMEDVDIEDRCKEERLRAIAAFARMTDMLAIDPSKENAEHLRTIADKLTQIQTTFEDIETPMQMTSRGVTEAFCHGGKIVLMIFKYGMDIYSIMRLRICKRLFMRADFLFVNPAQWKF